MKILVVDDEELICWSLKRTFEKKEGHSVCCVNTCNDAMKKIMENQYDVVITDLKLPDVNGSELVKKIKELGIDTPVIVISSYLPLNGMNNIDNNSVFRYISKPFQIEDLMNGVKEATVGSASFKV
ncbi:MAG: response regulator [Nitrospirae bacterium]|nr:response regulator [Nitrospirota bacterium]